MGGFYCLLLLREYAQMDKQVILVGQGKKFEIWADVFWEKSREDWLANNVTKDKESPTELLSLSI